MKKNARLIVFSNLISMTLASTIVYTITLPNLPGKAENVLVTNLPPVIQPQGNQQKEIPKTNEDISAKDISVKAIPSPTSKYTDVNPTYDNWLSVDTDINIRTEPSLNSTILMKTPAQSVFPLIKKNGEWDCIQLGMNQTGWIDWKTDLRKGRKLSCCSDSCR